MAAIYFNPDENPSFQDLVDSAFFVKLNVEDQIKRHKRTITPSSIEWWKKQCLNVKTKSVTPSPNDVLIEDGIEMMREWKNQFPNNKDCWVWARGNLDQLVIDSLEERLNIEPVFHYANWRDVRTAVDFLTGSKKGYCEVDYPGFESYIVTKHDPVHDCAYDIMMLLYGKQK